ncbi:MAG TPA: NosD domain-containing protein [Thermoanaerobaculia bacterium]|nr:NosD domain-containing protein [Thermoanaerobaculia bacterium]
MKMRKTTTWCAALGLALAAFSLVPAAGAQPFTDNIEIASQHPTLQAAINAAGEGGMLIVDRDYQNLSPLVLPRRFRMMGKGPQGNAVLAFQGLAAGSALSIAPSGDAYVVIEDLDIEGSFTPINGFQTSARGIDLTGSNIVFLRQVVVRGFDIGVYGEGSLSVFADNCNVSLSNTDNYQLTAGSNSWRITGGISSQAGRYGVNAGVVNDTLIHGVRMESNSDAAIFTEAVSTHITNNRFECWVDPRLDLCDATSRAVILGPSAIETTLVDNYYSGIGVVDQSTAHSTYRFDNGHAVEISPPAGTDALTVRLAGSASPEFEVDDQAWVQIGPDQGTKARLTVNTDSGEDALRVRTGGVTRLMVLSNGKVGVGTSVPGAKLQVASGDLYVSTVGNGVILRSPNGSCFRMTVSNAGTLGAAAVACP